MIAIGCSTPETVVVDSDPEPTSSSSENVSDRSETDRKFEHVKIGTSYPIHSLDPLFASNTGMMRIVQALYENLVTYNQEGEIVPEIAKSWTISDDSLTYTFNLRNDLYYHDSQAFANGLGRRVYASDVAFVFDRMAQSDVPATAARLFMNIRGFEPYFQEQRNVPLKKLRNIEGVAGVTANDQYTVSFKLTQPDPNFLQKLALPWASIYPRESIRYQDGGLHQNPVGTGPFTLADTRGDSVFILENSANYVPKNSPADTSKMVPRADRIDFIHTSKDRALVRNLLEGELDLIFEIPPVIRQSVVDSTGKLMAANRDNIRLFEYKNPAKYGIFANPMADTALTDDQAAFATNLAWESFTRFLPAKAKTFSEEFSVKPSTIAGEQPKLPKHLEAVYSEDPVIELYYRALATRLKAETPSRFRMLTIHTPIRETHIWGSRIWQISDRSHLMPASQSSLIHKFSVSELALAEKSLQGLKLNKLPWWTDYIYLRTTKKTL